eukprot:GHUV01001416.1.p1 GENE.GHUV01001416.1~~GHUV01001416.1.p1  ORF type:complete len:485 (+),score=84.31 GHUV01001416.1:159-1613(+)
MTLLPSSRKNSVGNHLGETVAQHQLLEDYNPKSKHTPMWRLYVYRMALGAMLVAACMLFSRGRAAPIEPPKELYTCINDGFDQQLTTYKDFAYQKPARMKLHKAWWSSKPPAVKVTIVTGLNPSRVNQLESQCISYKGPISAAVYVVLRSQDRTEGLTAEHKSTLQEAEQLLDEFHSRMEAANNCQIDILLLYETVLDDVMKVMFPINTLRNYALLQAKTPLVSMVDVDLIVSNALLQWLLEQKNYDQLREMTRGKTVVVLPAFETAPQHNMTLAHDLADTAAMMTKEQLGKLVQRRLIYQFALYLFRQGHNCTDYTKWFRADQPYDVEYHDGYEPWFIIDRFRNPWYDVSFRGYGWNKVSHVINIYYQNYKFLAHPTGFIVHRQHSRSSADKMYQAQKRGYERDVEAGKVTADRPNNNLAGLTHRFRDKVTAEMKAGNYTALIDDGIRNCVRILPWWKETKEQTERRQSQRRSLLRRFMHMLR